MNLQKPYNKCADLNDAIIVCFNGSSLEST